MVLLILGWRLLESMSKNSVLFLIFIIFVISSGILLFLKNRTNIFDQQSDKRGQSIFIKINNLTLKAEIAETYGERAQGLSGREFVSDDQGMFFLFKEPGRYPFWMKGMKFPIDIIWLDKDLKIIEITKGAQPESFPEIFQPTGSAKYVLEINAGLSDKYDLKEGDKCLLDKKLFGQLNL